MMKPCFVRENGEAHLFFFIKLFIFLKKYLHLNMINREN